MAVAEAPRPGQRPYRPYGGCEALWRCREGEVLLSGPAGTGKSRAALEKLHCAAHKYPGMQGLILRKTRASLTDAALKTFEEKVVPEGHPIIRRPILRETRKIYRYPNGSEIVVGGLDNPDRIMSTDKDMIYIQEATECTERDWEMATTRLRNGVMPYQQLLADCNPDSPMHWLYLRTENGQTRIIESRHEDNPSVGPEYLAKLDALTGVRYKRLRLGLWVAAEGIIYEGWDPAVHRIDRFEVPGDWPRIWSVDFGYVHPFCWGAWALDPDGRLYRYREIYHTHRLVEDHARQILEVTKGEPAPTAIVCDHDAEDRATLERHLGLGTTPAHKSISDGIQAVASRLRAEGDGKVRLFYLRDSLVERDPDLADRKLPCSTEEEYGGYIWNEGGGRRKGEEPLKEQDHGMDMTRYAVAFADELQPVYQAVSLSGAARPSGAFRWKTE